VLVKRVLFFLNAALAIAILHLISQVHLPSFVKILPKYLKDSTFSSCFRFIIIFTGDGCLEIIITFVFSKVTHTSIKLSKFISNSKILSANQMLISYFLPYITIGVKCMTSKAVPSVLLPRILVEISVSAL